MRAGGAFFSFGAISHYLVLALFWPHAPRLPLAGPSRAGLGEAHVRHARALTPRMVLTSHEAPSGGLTGSPGVPKAHDLTVRFVTRPD